MLTALTIYAGWQDCEIFCALGGVEEARGERVEV